MSKTWIYQLMEHSVDYCDQEGLERQKDLIESTPFGLIKKVFANCVTVVQVIERATYLLEEIDDMYYDTDSVRDPDQDDDPDWFDGEIAIPLHKIK